MNCIVRVSKFEISDFKSPTAARQKASRGEKFRVKSFRVTQKCRRIDYTGPRCYSGTRKNRFIVGGHKYEE